MKHILFDLDGTLIDPAEGLVASFQKGLAAVGVRVLPAAELGFIIGPPLRQSYPLAGVKEGDVEAALAAYRVHYQAGAMFQAAVYDGMHEVLTTLGARGHVMHVATSKPHVFARPILDHFELSQHFASIHGAELDGTRDAKADVIGYLLAQQAVAAKEALMIGDTRFDCIGAAAHGIPTIGVAWGHGGRADLEAAGAAVIAGHPRDLPGLIAGCAKGS
jgi:phosphoglycolate phosphatase